MASANRSSVASSSISSICLDDHHDPFTLDLQPPPLRIPHRKTDASFDGSASPDQQQTSRVINDPFTSPSAHHENFGHPPQPEITKTASQRRLPAPKLGPLVSKFEILDAVNNVEASPPPNVKPSGIPRAQGTLKGHGGSEGRRQQMTSFNRYRVDEYADVSPRQVASPPPSSGSKLPVSNLFKTTTDDAKVGSRRSSKAEEKAPARGKDWPLVNYASPIRGLKDSSHDHSPSHGTASQIGSRPG
ncbi:hypothetical protein F4819DRAFT_150115 [Hypoxylon fuscum]|nr:hypothetical protein F4819DRAFT_150115 [Hypoxylon fuscum]